MHDSWGEGNARRAQENVPQQPPTILREFNPAFNKGAMESLDKLYEDAVNTSKSTITGVSPTGGIQRTYNEDETKKAKAIAQSKINQLAMDLSKRGLIKLPESGKVPQKNLAE